jgi:uncharacterized protein with von Willebrand factor type A (vWA) domain
VRPAAAFLLELVYAAHDLFTGTRSFVFVSEVGEATALFDGSIAPDAAFAHIWSGAVVPLDHDSNYGRALRAFEAHSRGFIDRRTTVVVLGDGRGNYYDSAPDVLDRIRGRARAVVWLSTEPRGQWGQGDSAMFAYAPRCSAVLEACCVADLEKAARALARCNPA